MEESWGDASFRGASASLEENVDGVPKMVILGEHRVSRFQS